MTDAIQELVAKGDKDRYLSCLFAPETARPHLLALYAFNIEIARIRDTVSEPQLGLVRQQWWLDSIEAIYAGITPEHPVAIALGTAIAFAGLPKEPLRNLIVAREFDLYNDAMPSLHDLEGYLGETSSSLMQMAALILGKGAADVAGLAGVAFGIELDDFERFVFLAFGDELAPIAVKIEDGGAWVVHRLVASLRSLGGLAVCFLRVCQGHQVREILPADTARRVDGGLGPRQRVGGMFVVESVAGGLLP